MNNDNKDIEEIKKDIKTLEDRIDKLEMVIGYLVTVSKSKSKSNPDNK